MEKVEIVVTATDSASQVLRGITSQFGELGNIIQGVTGGRALEFLTGEVIKFGKESVEAFTNSAMAAKQLSRLSGESIENSSRFIQVLDDFGLKQEDALAATKALTKQGLEPNIATLAKLSDQYREIKDPQEKNEFILKNLGRAGLQWTQVLEQGSKALNDHAAAINKNLIMTDEMWQKAEKLRIAQDDLNDSWEATKIQVGNQLVPVMADAVGWFNRWNVANEDNIKGWEKWVPGALVVHGAINGIRTALEGGTVATNDMTDAQDALTDSSYKTAEQIKAEEEAAKALTEKLKGYLDLAGNLYDEQKNYTQSIGDLQKQRAKILDDMAKAEEEGSTKASRAAVDYKEKLSAINDKIEERKKKDKDVSDLVDQRATLERHYAEDVADGLDNVNGKADDYKQKLEDIDQKIKETEEAHHAALGKMSYDLIVTKLSADGLTSAEYDIAVQAGLTFGVFDQKSADAAIAMNALTDKVAAGKISVYEYGQIIQSAMQNGQLNAAELQRIIAEIPDHKTIDVVANFTSNVPFDYMPGPKDEVKIPGTNIKKKAGGGDVLAGMLYQVNETRTEYFQPAMSGTVIPLGGKGAGGITITYAPQMSLGNLAEFQTVILPFVEKAVRQMQSDGRVPQ